MIHLVFYILVIDCDGFFKGTGSLLLSNGFNSAVVNSLKKKLF